MPEKEIFRCPFEVQGMESGSIHEVSLGNERSERLRDMHAALTRLRHDQKIDSVRFILPESVVGGCTSFDDLNERILPYQVEFLAADIDSRLYPHLPYHPAWQRFKARFKRSRRHARYAARALEIALETGGYGMPQNLVDLADMLEELFLDTLAEGDPDPIFIFGWLRKWGQKYWLFRMERGAFGIYTDQNKLHDPTVNDANFSIIKAPLYPAAFGRFSERYELVVTRDVDVVRLPDTVKMRIRSDANRVHRAHGINVKDLFDQQPTGLWIPK